MTFKKFALAAALMLVVCIAAIANPYAAPTSTAGTTPATENPYANDNGTDDNNQVNNPRGIVGHNNISGAKAAYRIHIKQLAGIINYGEEAIIVPDSPNGLEFGKKAIEARTELRKQKQKHDELLDRVRVGSATAEERQSVIDQQVETQRMIAEINEAIIASASDPVASGNLNNTLEKLMNFESRLSLALAPKENLQNADGGNDDDGNDETETATTTTVASDDDNNGHGINWWIVAGAIVFLAALLPLSIPAYKKAFNDAKEAKEEKEQIAAEEAEEAEVERLLRVMQRVQEGQKGDDSDEEDGKVELK